MTRKRVLLGLITLLLAVIFAVGLVGCQKKVPDGETPVEETPATGAVIPPSPSPVSPNTPMIEDTAFKGYSFVQQTAENIPVTYSPLNMSTAAMNEQGIYGEGCQWPVAFESSADGSIMFYGIDVAGMYRSTDHGVTWEKCNTGVVSRGIGMFGIDPKNPSHVLATGLSGSSAKNTGMYISYNGGETWRPTGFNVKIGGARYLWDGLTFDPTSYDAGAGVCLTAYYSIPYMRDRTTRLNAYKLSAREYTLAEGKQGLYKSTDGGESFVQLSDDGRLADGILKITDNGNILIGNQHGLFRINSDGQILNSWLINEFSDYENDKITITLADGKTADILKCYLGITGLDCVGNTVYAQTWDGIYTLNFSSVVPSDTAEIIPQIITGSTYRSQNWPQFLAVSKSNPDHIVYQYRGRVDKVSWDTYWTNYIDVSTDGGKTWTTAVGDMSSVFVGGTWSSREKLIIIDPSDDDNVLCFGSDFIMRSSDGGFNFVQASGVSNMMCGGKMHFNYYDRDLIFAGAQDYTGTVSTDGGVTFNRLKITVNGTSYNHFYDGFAADAYTYFGFARPSWTGENRLIITFDGGKTWSSTGITMPYGTPGITLQSYNTPDVLFAGPYRSADRGRSWEKMNGCICVCTVSYGDHMILGYDEQKNIVCSTDDGVNWRMLFNRVELKFNSSPRTVDEDIRDLAYDFVNHIIYAVVDSHHINASGESYNSHAYYKIVLDENLNFVERKTLPVHGAPDGYANLSDIEIDPNATNVIYITGAGNYFSNRYALQRSIDGGETWQVLTSNTDPEGPTGGLCTNRGGYEASMLAVDPATGRVLIGCGCYGFEWFNPPYPALTAAPVEHKIVFAYGDRTVNTVTVKNNRTIDYIYDEDGLTFDGWYLDEALTVPWDGGYFVNSKVLYAKMLPAKQILFYVNNTLLGSRDIEYYHPNIDIPQPSIDGYVFVGWYKEETLDAPVDFRTITDTVSVYAGFVKVGNNIYDGGDDYAAYLQYSNKRLSSTERVPDGADADNRCAYMDLNKNTDYLLVFKMDARCRYGLNKNDFVANRAPDVYYIDERDTNGSASVDEWVYLSFNSGENTRLLLFYYTANSDSGYAHTQIKQTVRCYETDDPTVRYYLD